MPEITPTELAREILRELDVRRASAETTPVRCIQLAICQRAGITLREMLSHRRTARLALPRHMAIWLCWVVTGLSTPTLGRLFGDRDHTTIMHATSRIAAMMADDPSFAAEMRALLLALTGGEPA